MKHFKCNSLHVVFLTMVCGLLFSCRNPQPEASQLLARAITLVDENPDSALRLIDSIFYPEEMPKYKYMEYLVRRVQVNYKTYNTISTDTLIFKARDYFRKFEDKDWKQSFLAAFYSGCVYREQQRYDAAIKLYKDALTLARKNKDQAQEAFVLYNIADLFFDKRLYVQSLENYKKAEKLFITNPERRADCLLAMAQAALMNGSTETSLAYLEEGYNLAKADGNEKMQTKFLQTMSVTYAEKEDYRQSLIYLKQAFKINKDSQELSRYYLNFANTYYALGEKDSLNYYINKLQQTAHEINDIYFIASTHDFLAQKFYNQRNYRLAFMHLQQKDSCVMEIMETKNAKALVDADRKYDMSQKEMQLIRANSNNYRLLAFLFIILFVCFSIAGVVVYLYKNRKREQQINIQLKNDAEKAIYINQLYQRSVNNIAALKQDISSLASRYDATHKEKDSGYAKIQKKLKEIEEDTTYGYSHSVADFLQAQNPLNKVYLSNLKVEEQLLLSLLYCNYPNAHIATILQINPHTLTTRKARLKIKLQKIGVPDKEINSLFPTK